MDIFGERTAPVLLSPLESSTTTTTTTSSSSSSLTSSSSSSITASTFLPGSTSRGSRSRTRMATSMERNFYTFIFLSWALVILILSPSASANRCTPTFTLLSNGAEGGTEEYENGSSLSSSPTEEEPLPTPTRVTIREQSAFKLNCSLNMFHTVKWTINGRDISAQLRNEWDIDIEVVTEGDGTLFTELKVNNASQKWHAGEYKCTSQCMNKVPGANLGVTVSINIAINVTIADSKPGLDPKNIAIYRKYVGREKPVDIKCKAPVPNAQMTWHRIKDDNREEDMAEVCVGPDVELVTRLKHPPNHCTITAGGGNDDSSLTLRINRARKEGNETLKTISDFRRFICRASKDQQDGHAYLDLLETVSLDRKFKKGERSVSVIEGDKLKIYCDVHGVDKKEFDAGGTASLVWTKDGEVLDVKVKDGVERIGKIEVNERGKPFRVGYLYDMAEPHHRGQYTCEVLRPLAPDVETTSKNSTKRVSFTYYVRVKDKLGALWPFLGICGEVVILCTIILIYEKRRNKTELDESDTDGNADQ